MPVRHCYDPLTDSHLSAGYDTPSDSYWAEEAGPWELTSESPLPDTVDYLILGAGYTGLNAALTLAESTSAAILVVDAGDVGAGASGRNAGFLLPGTGRLGLSDYKKKYGTDTANAVQNEFATGIDTVLKCVNQIKRLTGDDCQLKSARYLRFAHSNKLAETMEASVNSYRQTQLRAEWLSPAKSASLLPGIRHAFGALALEPAMSVQPLRLARGYARVAADAGVQFSLNNPVVKLQHKAGGTYVHTAKGVVFARKLLICGNAYLPRKILPTLGQRQFPVMSAINVTEPLTDEQLKFSGLTTDMVMMDTRMLKYYYRLLPDNRLLFGGRGAISGRDAMRESRKDMLHQAMTQTFPMLEQVKVSHHWSGWVSVALDAMPRVFSPRTDVHTAMGYCGAGVSFTALAGQRLAEQALGHPLPPLPFYQSALPRYPLPGLRRLALRMLYRFSAR